MAGLSTCPCSGCTEARREMRADRLLADAAALLREALLHDPASPTSAAEGFERVAEALAVLEREVGT